MFEGGNRRHNKTRQEKKPAVDAGAVGSRRRGGEEVPWPTMAHIHVPPQTCKFLPASLFGVRLKWNAAQCHNSILPSEKVIGTRSRSSTGADVCLSSRLVTLVRRYLMSEVFSRSRFDRPMKYYSEMFPQSDGSMSCFHLATCNIAGYRIY